jgi:hypothetical protein
MSVANIRDNLVHKNMLSETEGVFLCLQGSRSIGNQKLATNAVGFRKENRTRVMQVWLAFAALTKFLK